MCFDRDTGALLWQAGPEYNQPELTMKENNPYCSASPVTDGKRVIGFFGSAGLYCFDMAGKELWSVDLGKISHAFGTASSPYLWGDYCFAYVGPGGNETIVAVNKRDGSIAWRVPALNPRPQDMARVSSNGPPIGSWSTPLVIDNHGRKELVMACHFRFGAFDPQKGNLLWEHDGLGLQTYVTPLWTDGMLIPMSGLTAMAVRPPFGGKPAETVWSNNKTKFRYGSGVATATHLFYLSENGFAECWDKKTGQVVWQERLSGPGRKTSSWSSLTLAGKAIYAPNQSGDVFVFAAEPVFRMLSANSVAEPTNASLAHSQDRIFMRTDQALWCFGTRG